MTIRSLVQRPGSYDSRLDPPRPPYNCSQLTLVLRIFLRQMNPPGGSATGTLHRSGHSYSYQRWQPAEWTQYCNDFESVTERVWNGRNGRLFLSPESPIPRSLRRDMMHATLCRPMDPDPYMECRLDIQIMTSITNSHAAIRCYRIADSEPQSFRSYVVPQPGRDTGEMDDMDVAPYVSIEGTFYAAPHEVAHLLGLDHPNMRAHGCHTGNEDICYGPPASPMRRRVTGAGTVITPGEAGPWLSRVRLHTRSQHRWHATITDPRHEREMDRWMNETFNPFPDSFTPRR